MDTGVAVALVVVGALAAWGLWYATRAFKVWRRLGGDRVVTCPETGQPAAVHIDMALAVTSDSGSAPPPLDACSRWSERGPCEQACAAAAQLPESAASAIVMAWANGRNCVTCGRQLVDSRFSGHHIALLEPTGMTREWVDIAADRLPLALATSLPICWDCHVASTFRRMYPELVTDRDGETVEVHHS